MSSKPSRRLVLAALFAALASTACGGPVTEPGGSDDGTTTSPGGGSSGSSSSNSSKGTLVIINRSGATIQSVYLAPAGSGTWSSDILGSDLIPTNTRMTISGVPAGRFDMALYFGRDRFLYHNNFTVPAGRTFELTVN